ncbi:MAG: ferritin-like domain-containing protein [Bacteroidia bacterium]|jgi:rubrerythrin|nr:MAG: ferritin-like domain-containing protein [Bacteroidia bacterium]
MATMVGTQKSFTQAIKELVELDYDALGAYESAINNLENPEYKKKFEEFKLDHQRHITELSAFLSRCNETAPSGPDNMKKVLVKGKVELASLFGDQNILSAMLSNEEDTNTAYERINARIGEAADKEIAKIIAGGLADERKHRDWIQSNISQQDK